MKQNEFTAETDKNTGYFDRGGAADIFAAIHGLIVAVNWDCPEIRCQPSIFPEEYYAERIF
ncbi:hypothetical protein [Paraburkholderia ferrariae]|uniref:hypothetical protein n=1 Tax=Paraburkholderia ferrariae TaxID=386056 RepID=UPI0012EB0CB4|nr:hypothetical protein [Paraburkholderia ferrariae]